MHSLQQTTNIRQQSVTHFDSCQPNLVQLIGLSYTILTICTTQNSQNRNYNAQSLIYAHVQQCPSHILSIYDLVLNDTALAKRFTLNERQFAALL